MRPSDTQPAVASKDDQPEAQSHPQAEPDDLEGKAASLTSQIAILDDQIADLKAERTAAHKDLRAVTSRLVTLKLKAK